MGAHMTGSHLTNNMFATVRTQTVKAFKTKIKAQLYDLLLPPCER